jgi:hypothetical protein
MTMRRSGLGILVGLGLALALAAPAAAADVNLGVRGGVYLDDSDPFLGADLLVPIANSDLAFNPSVEVAFPSDGSLYTVNFDVLWNFHRDGPVDFWAGVGPAYMRFDPPGRAGALNSGAANLIFGAAWNVGKAFQPYAQVKVVIPGSHDIDTQGVLAVGLRF